MKHVTAVCAFVSVFAASSSCRGLGEQDPQPAATEDRAAIQRAALDYVLALYDAEPERIRRSVHPELKKYGFYRPKGAADYRGSAMTFEQLVALAGEWNKDGSKADEASPKKVEILDVMDQTAVVKLTAKWGIDHMQLAKFDGKWQILHILWQSAPPNG